MNTADRSIATLDTALRRRFRFKEMLPDSSVLEGIYVEDVSVREILEKMNKRITVLYDREHTIGHAYFVPLKSSRTIETLGHIFSDTIIPLLQEYFYEDYEKIRMVLGDNNKGNESEQFIKAVDCDFTELFGNVDFEMDDARMYEINQSAFSNIEAYRNI
jgi:5-methylcytosine-specific restriction protein B